MIDYTHATATNTPAQILYDRMKDAIEVIHGPYDQKLPANMSQSVFWGVDLRFGVSFHSLDALTRDPIIAFGDLYMVPGSVYPKLYLTSDGRFQLGFMWGWGQRAVVEKNTFLAWSYEYRKYNWFYRPIQQGGMHYRDDEIRTWAWTRSYVPDHLITTPNIYRHKLGWARLIPDTTDPEGWAIVHAEDGRDTNANTPMNTAAQFARFYDLREKRYKRITKAHEIEIGLRDAKGRKIETEDERRERQQQAAEDLSAHFLVSAPARTTPLRKHKEEGLWLPNGSH